MRKKLNIYQNAPEPDVRIPLNALPEGKAPQKHLVVTAQNTYLQCPAHADFEITNICLSKGCLEPLCPLCVKIHVSLHNEKKDPAHIETMHDSRIFCQQRLEQLLSDLQKENRDVDLLVSKNFESIWESQKSILDRARTKIYTIVESYFQVIEQEVLQNINHLSKIGGDSFVMQLSEKLKANINELERLFQKINSPDYVKTVLKVLTDDFSSHQNVIQREIDAVNANNKGGLLKIKTDDSRLYEINKTLKSYIETITPPLVEKNSVNKDNLPSNRSKVLKDHALNTESDLDVIKSPPIENARKFQTKGKDPIYKLSNLQIDDKMFHQNFEYFLKHTGRRSPTLSMTNLKEELQTSGNERGVIKIQQSQIRSPFSNFKSHMPPEGNLQKFGERAVFQTPPQKYLGPVHDKAPDSHDSRYELIKTNHQMYATENLVEYGDRGGVSRRPNSIHIKMENYFVSNCKRKYLFYFPEGKKDFIYYRISSKKNEKKKKQKRRRKGSSC